MKRFVNDIKKYSMYIIYATKARLKAEVTNSYLNWIWWILEPFCYMLIYTIIFGYIFKSGEQYFPIYIFIGSTMWNFFSKTIMTSVSLVRAKESIIAKVYIPKYILLLVEMLVNGFKFLVSSSLTIFMIIIFRVHVTIYALWVIPILVVFFIITFGIATIIMHYGIYINDLTQVIGIMLSMLMYFTGIFFSIDTRVEEPLCSILGIGNPVAFLLTSTRKVVMYEMRPDYLFLFVWFIIALVIAALGVRLVYKNENTYVKIM